MRIVFIEHGLHRNTVSRRGLENPFVEKFTIITQPRLEISRAKNIAVVMVFKHDSERSLRPCSRKGNNKEDTSGFLISTHVYFCIRN